MLPRTVRDRTIASEINAPHVYGKWKKTALFARRRVRKPQYLHCAPWKTCGIRKGIERLHRPAVPASACTGPPNRPNGITLARLQRTGRELRAWRGGPGRGLFRARQPSRHRAATDQHAQLGASAAGSVMRIEKLCTSHARTSRCRGRGREWIGNGQGIFMWNRRGMWESRRRACVGGGSSRAKNHKSRKL